MSADRVRPAAVPLAPATVLCLADGRELAFAEYGDPDGVPVIAFHGTPGSRLQLAPAHAAARAAGVRMIAIDRPGYAHSSFVRGRQLRDWPSDVAAVADHLALHRFAVLGVSGGGPHALACAVGLPKRVTAVGVVSSPSPPAGAPPERRGSTPRLSWIAFRVLIRFVVTLLLAAARKFPLTALRIGRRWMPDADQRVVDDPAFAAYFQDTSQRMSGTTARAVAQDLELFAGDWRLDLGDIDVPVMIWHGSDDRLVEPRNAEALAKSIPGAWVDVVAGEGHLLFAVFAGEILRDLARVSEQAEG